MVKKKPRTFYSIGKLSEVELLRREFEYSLGRRVAERVRRGWIKTYKPVMDDVPYRVFESMAEYRRWCDQALPEWLGYGQAG